MYPIFVFSFNRGRFLAHCIASIEACVSGAQVIIIDDGSDDPRTLAQLEYLSSKYRVLGPTRSSDEEIKTGGLYSNMNLALNIAEARNERRALFIQDDMQLVRTVTGADCLFIDGFFDANPGAIQIQPCFRRRESLSRLVSCAFLDNSGSAFFLPSIAEKGKDNFSATGVFDIKRVRDFLGEFSVGEGRNSFRCRSLGIKKGLAAYPFMSWLPYPPSFRGRRRSIIHRSMEFFGGAGFHPIDMMSDDDSQRLLHRQPVTLPVVEDWLFSPSAPRHDRWSTGGGEYNLIARGGLIGAAYNSLRKSKKSVTGWFK